MSVRVFISLSLELIITNLIEHFANLILLYTRIFTWSTFPVFFVYKEPGLCVGLAMDCIHKYGSLANSLCFRLWRWYTFSCSNLLKLCSVLARVNEFHWSPCSQVLNLELKFINSFRIINLDFEVFLLVQTKFFNFYLAIVCFDFATPPPHTPWHLNL